MGGESWGEQGRSLFFFVLVRSTNYDHSGDFFFQSRICCLCPPLADVVFVYTAKKYMTSLVTDVTVVVGFYKMLRYVLSFDRGCLVVKDGDGASLLLMLMYFSFDADKH